jgi:hypothetical protein
LAQTWGDITTASSLFQAVYNRSINEEGLCCQVHSKSRDLNWKRDKEMTISQLKEELKGKKKRD